MNDQPADEADPQLQVRLLVVGDPMDHKLVTATLGLEPTSTHAAGEPMGNGRMIAKASQWIHSLVPVEGYDAGAQVAMLFEKLAGNEDSFRDMHAAGLEVEVRIVAVLGDGPFPYLGLGRDVIERLARIGADLDVDIYEHGARDLMNERHPI